MTRHAKLKGENYSVDVAIGSSRAEPGLENNEPDPGILYTFNGETTVEDIQQIYDEIEEVDRTWIDADSGYNQIFVGISSDAKDLNETAAEYLVNFDYLLSDEDWAMPPENRSEINEITNKLEN